MIKSVRIQGGPCRGSEEVAYEAAEKNPGYRVLWAFYDDSVDEFEILLLKICDHVGYRAIRFEGGHKWCGICGALDSGDGWVRPQG